MDAGQNNLHQQLQGQQQQQHLSPITTQTSTPPVMSPVCCDHDRPPLCFLFFSLLPAFQFYILNLSPYVLHIFMYIFRLFLFARDSFMHLKEKRLIPIKSLALLFNQQVYIYNSNLLKYVVVSFITLHLCCISFSDYFFFFCR